VVVVSLEREERTQREVTTHTAGLAGDAAFVSELLRAHDVIEVADLVEFTELLAALQGVRRAAGRRIGVITSSGGLAELILDTAASADLQLPPLSARQSRKSKAKSALSAATAIRSTRGAMAPSLRTCPTLSLCSIAAPIMTSSPFAATIAMGNRSKCRRSRSAISSSSFARRRAAKSRITCFTRGPAS